MDEYAEDLPGPRLPADVEEYMAREREWHRFLRGTGGADDVGRRADAVDGEVTARTPSSDVLTVPLAIVRA
ncbi:hypothetical protein [Mycobacteroides abscessus]|uniref:hypothetical protein n=1 Tax=Mycobacteroides abscessus TaxID=36809 RepID=UPI0009A754FC|nr:hypothetical protein [Mycobacteroides abscessus]